MHCSESIQEQRNREWNTAINILRLLTTELEGTQRPVYSKSGMRERGKRFSRGNSRQSLMLMAMGTRPSFYFYARVRFVDQSHFVPYWARKARRSWCPLVYARPRSARCPSEASSPAKSKHSGLNQSCIEQGANHRVILCSMMYMRALLRQLYRKLSG
jgi:hypothetical protein